MLPAAPVLEVNPRHPLIEALAAKAAGRGADRRGRRHVARSGARAGRRPAARSGAICPTRHIAAWIVARSVTIDGQARGQCWSRHWSAWWTHADATRPLHAVRPVRACRVSRQPAAGAVPLPSSARLHRGRAGTDVPARRRRRRRRGARSWRRQFARRIRQSGVPPAGGRALALAARRLRSRVRHPWLLSRRLSLRCAEGGQARTGAAAGARAASSAAARRPPPPGWCAIS